MVIWLFKMAECEISIFFVQNILCALDWDVQTTVIYIKYNTDF